MEKVNTLTIGAGGGAYPAAFRLARAGRRVIMVDMKGVMSGNCLAEGCVPSKAIREVAELFRRTKRNRKFGLYGNGNFNYAQIVAHKDRVQKSRYDQHIRELAAMGDRLQLVKGTARLIEPHVVEVKEDSGVVRYEAENIILASGADIAIPPIKGAELCLTSRDIYGSAPSFVRLPERMAVIGAGYIGLETAGILAVFGVKVSVLEMTAQALPGMDPDFANQLACLLDPAIELILNARVVMVERRDTALRVHYLREGKEMTIEAEQVLMAVGRKPVIPEGCPETGIEIERGQVKISPALQTGFPHIYACGDVNGRSPLFHSAVRQSLVAAHNISGGNIPSDYMDFDSIPVTVFTFPEGAYVGITRAVARQRGITTVEADYQFREDSRAQIFDEPAGELRLFFEAGTLRLLGGWVIGIDAANLIGEIGLAVSSRLTAHDLARFADPHPMASEGISKAARKLF